MLRQPVTYRFTLRGCNSKIIKYYDKYFKGY